MFRTATLLVASFTMLCAAQAFWTRRRMPRLLAAGGAHAGRFECAGVPLNLLVVGESSVAGVGVRDLADGLAAQIARELNARTSCAVRWQAVGRPGASVRTLRNHLVEQWALQGPPAFRADVAVFAVGVNDTLRLRWPHSWYHDVRALLQTVGWRHTCRIIALSPVPPLWQFRSLPLLLRVVLGVQAFVLDRMLRRIARHDARVLYVPIRLPEEPRLLAHDGFHPSAAGYRTWAIHMARAIATVPCLMPPRIN
jgi:lysophospholipase L1-like esterase